MDYFRFIATCRQWVVKACHPTEGSFELWEFCLHVRGRARRKALLPKVDVYNLRFTPVLLPSELAAPLAPAAADECHATESKDEQQGDDREDADEGLLAQRRFRVVAIADVGR